MCNENIKYLNSKLEFQIPAKTASIIPFIIDLCGQLFWFVYAAFGNNDTIGFWWFLKSISILCETWTPTSCLGHWLSFWRSEWLDLTDWIFWECVSMEDIAQLLKLTAITQMELLQTFVKIFCCAILRANLKIACVQIHDRDKVNFNARDFQIGARYGATKYFYKCLQ